MFGTTEGSATRTEMLRGLKYSSTNTDSIAEGYKAFNENVEKTNGLKIGKLWL